MIGAHLNKKDARKLSVGVPTFAQLEARYVRAREDADEALDTFRRALRLEIEAHLQLRYARELKRK